MSKDRIRQVLAEFGLTSDQEEAALVRGQDVAVTAGAGSGKTSTLVARYVTLLAKGIDLRRVIAVTFTDKAAMEMRARAREKLRAMAAKTVSDEDRQFWGDLYARMDSARISTIHSLCAEILRAHPVEAVIDPKFEVLDESQTVILQAQVVEDTLSALVGLPEFEPLFRLLNSSDIRNLLETMLVKRLEMNEVLKLQEDPSKIIRSKLTDLLQEDVFVHNISTLRSFSSNELLADAGENLAAQIRSMLAAWSEAETALADGDVISCAHHLFDARRHYMALNIGSKTSSAKDHLRALQSGYDEFLDPICGGKDSKSQPPTAESEENFAVALVLVKEAFSRMLENYREAMQDQLALDFDDLEQGAADLLQDPAIQAAWQAQVDAILVDEFQDTNLRQRQIVEALAGSGGRLFVVGDAKQSIYRFRQADVTVFRSLREDIKKRDGRSIDLDTTFRAHAPLLEGMNDLLKEFMGDVEDPVRPYFEPFAPLRAFRLEPGEGYASPHIEFVYGRGEKAEEGRTSASRALAGRLIELKQAGQFSSWDEVTLLFRSSNSFPSYETAFEEAGIPFVTVAGKGFYDRAEIRDVLNLLRAIDDPSNDLAMAGLLRSPAFGLSDAALFQLRWQEGQMQGYWAALYGDLSILAEEDRRQAERTLKLLKDLIPLVDRIPVAELLKKLVDATDLRSILAIPDQEGGSGRLWRNLDKLIADARESGLVTVRDFLDNLKAIDEAGAREGEAPAEARGSVRLMTIHKAKGLQYPVLVLADASRKAVTKGEAVYLEPEMGLAFKMDPEPMIYSMLKELDKRKGETEEGRILYVALTRASQKLIINGYAKSDEKEGWKTDRWLDALGQAAGVDLPVVCDKAGQALTFSTAGGQPVRAWAIAEDQKLETVNDKTQEALMPEPDDASILAALPEPPMLPSSEEEIEEGPAWHAVSSAGEIPPGAVGKMVHKAIELWKFPGEPALQNVLETTAFQADLSLASQREDAVRRAVELLTRLQEHPLRQDIEGADERHHEIPYSIMAGDFSETGYIDLLYKNASGWHIMDFKTDAIYNGEDLEKLVMEYKDQLQRYAHAVKTLTGEPVEGSICFLDAFGHIQLKQVTG